MTNISTDKAISLWNPNAAVNWSVLFTPIFGAWIQAKTWKALGEADKAKTSMFWVYGTIIITALMIIRETGGIGGLITLLPWYFLSARSQSKYVKEKFGDSYAKKGWGEPISIAVGVVIIGAIVLYLLTGNSYSGSSGSNTVQAVTRHTCDSKETIDGLKDLFNDSPFATTNGYKYVGLENILEIVYSEQTGNLYCVGSMMTNGGVINIKYNLDKQQNGDGYWMKFEQLSDQDYYAISESKKIENARNGVQN